MENSPTFDKAQALTAILSELNAGWWIRDEKKQTFNFSDHIKELTGLRSNVISYKDYLAMVREDYRDRMTESVINAPSGEMEQEKIYPIETVKGTLWIKTKTVQYYPSNDGVGSAVGYLQAIENPEIAVPETASSLRRSNLLFQLNNISKILLSFLQSNDPDKIVNDILRDMLKQFKAGRTYIFEYDWENKVQSNTYEVVDSKVKPEIEFLANLPLQVSAWWTEQIRAGKHIVLSTLDDLPPEAEEEKNLLAYQDVNSLYVAPLMSKNGAWGYAGVDIVDGFHTWSEEDRHWLSSLVNIISFCIQMHRSEDRAQRGMNYLQSLYTNMPLGYLRLQLMDDETGDFIYLDANESADKLFGQPLTECKGRKASESLNCFGAELKELHGFAKGSHLDMEYYIEKSKKYTRLIAYSIHAGEVICLFSDITESHNVRQNLIVAKEKAEVSDRLKSAFLANMSHEIRTPLNAIVGFSDLLSQCDDVEERETYSKIVHENNDLLLQLISDILDISKIEAGTLDIVNSRIDVNELCRELIYFYHMKTADSPVKVSMDQYMSSCILMSDKNRIKQIISNFVNNALKFTTQGKIEIGYQLLDERTIKFYVRDTGTGIDPAKLDTVFNRFTKLDSFTSGTGLGLAISKSLVEQMGGEIGVESVPGKGSCFWFTHPFDLDIQNDIVVNSYAQRRPTAPQITARQDGEMPVILVAEDTDSNYFLLASTLSKQFKLLRAQNGFEAVEIYERESPDLILMDMKMPEMDGLEATQRIRAVDTNIPIIAVTAYAFDNDREEAMKAGCDHLFTKPISINELLLKMRELMG